MTYKNILIFSLLLSVTINVFAADFTISAGGGGLLGYTFTRYKLEGGDITSTQDMDRFDFGGYIFADFTYAELSIIIQGGSNSYREIVFNEFASMNNAGIGQEGSLGFSLFGKYPFNINEKITWFPLLGVSYHIALQQLRKPEGDSRVHNRADGRLMEDQDKDGLPFPLTAWNSFNIILGAGADYYFSKNLFIRGEFLFGFRLPTDYEMGALEVVEYMFGIDNLKLGGINGSPTIKIAVGYNFDNPFKFMQKKQKPLNTAVYNVITEGADESEEYFPADELDL